MTARKKHKAGRGSSRYSPAWRDTSAGHALYLQRRADAQARANATGFDHGLEANDVFRDFHVRMLPRRENRYGHELAVEVVHPEDLAKTQPGHGYARGGSR